MKALDLFCGLGGWSDGLALEGFEVLGVEINPEIASLYKHPVLVEDVRNLYGNDFQGYDLIVGSPPCRDFSKMGAPFGHKWLDPPKPERGLELVNTFLKFVSRVQPRYWLMENVPNLKNYLELKPRCRVYLGRGMPRCFWGSFPSFLIPRDYRVELKENVKGPLRKWERARIPLPIARALGKAVKNAIKEARR